MKTSRQVAPPARRGLAVHGGFIQQRQARLVEFAVDSRQPAMYGHRSYPERGGLMAYDTDFDHLFRRAATYVDRILKGATPAELPIEEPTRFDFIVNLKTA